MIKILIMDDEPALRNIVFNMVKPLGHTMFTAEDGTQAIAIGKKEMLDIALLDMRVPDMDGLEVLTELKKINPGIKCIMLSGFGDVETAVSAIKQGAFDYISKPFKIEEVLKVIDRAIGARSEGAPAVTTPAPVSAPVLEKPRQTPVSTPPPQTEVRKTAASVTKKPLIIGIGGALVLALIGVVLMRTVFKGGNVKEFVIPYTNPTGISWIKPHLWVSDWVTGNVYQHNVDSKLSIASVYKTANTQPTGLTYDGESIWTCSSTEKRIYKHKLDAALTVEAIFATSGGNPSGLYFDGANLWVLDSDAAKIYKHKMDDMLTMVSTYDSPAMNPCGMFKNGEHFFIGDYKTGKIYKVSVKDFSTAEVYTIPYFEKNNYKLAGLGWDGQNIWLSAEGQGKLFQMPLPSLKAIKF